MEMLEDPLLLSAIFICSTFGLCSFVVYVYSNLIENSCSTL